MGIETGHAGDIVCAIAQLQQAFRNAGLKEPVALVIAGNEQYDRLQALFVADGHQPHTMPFWRKPTIRGLQVLYDLPA